MSNDQVPVLPDQFAGGIPEGQPWEKVARGALQIAGGAVPFAGGLLSLLADHLSGREQKRAYAFIEQYLNMLRDELQEKNKTIGEIIVRLDLHDEAISERIRSSEYQSLLKKAFRNWAGVESERKRNYIRNILTNAAASQLVSDDVVGLFLDWLHTYSEFHFMVISDIYQHPGSTRNTIWNRLGRGQPREDSAEADLYKLLFRDLATGGVIRQHRETDYAGNFLRKTPQKVPRGARDPRMKSAFDDDEGYELTALGAQFIHYAMQELVPKIEYNPDQGEEDVAS